ncbi:EF-hand domain-containing protein [Phyllobacterium zundukense]|uniref:EF-hand domain-containing protein n=1 Tax=Phyllobacterium zundukense TaxID=1867719 RepID=A0ACD4CY62_9HYPH|nr:EF-hand domain-containing protein [Phyllobacterium zundukense]UXN58498.1 EF-hand domain-containing protein [Phyllobacterium zundukense]
MKTKIATAVSALLLCTAVATAQQPTPMYEGHRDQLDTNDNGSVNRTEYQAFMNDAFKKLDTNGDGSLRAGEVGKVLTPAQFAATDRDGNGNVSQKEFMNQVMADFAKTDRSGDGQLQ